MSKHTPGPWRIGGEEHPYGVYVVAEDGDQRNTYTVCGWMGGSLDQPQTVSASSTR